MKVSLMSELRCACGSMLLRFKTGKGHELGCANPACAQRGKRFEEPSYVLKPVDAQGDPREKVTPEDGVPSLDAHKI